MKNKFILFCFFIFTISFVINSKSITFKFEVPKINSKWNEFSQTDMSIKVKATSNGKEISNYIARNYKLIKKEVVVLENDENNVKKIKVTYKQTESINNDNGTETKNSEYPVLNKTYIIEKAIKQNDSDPKFKINYEDGTDPSEEELNFILKEDYEKANDLDYNSSEIKDKTIDIGQKVDFFNKLFEDLIGSLNTESEGSENKKDYSVTLKSVKKINGIDCGAFELNFKLSYKDPQSGMTVLLNLAGEIYIAVNSSQILKFYLKGPMTMDGSFTNKKDANDKTDDTNDKGIMIVKGDGLIDYQYDQPIK